MSRTETARAAQGAQDRASLADRLRAKKPLRTTHEVVIDPEVWERVLTARAELDRARLFDSDTVTLAEQRTAEAEAEARELGAVEVLTLQAVPRPVYEALILAHPPTEEQKAQDHAYNVDTLAPALVAAAVVDPDSGEHPLTAEDVAELWATWNQGEVFALWSAALTVCTQARNPTVPFGSGRTRG